MLLRVLLAQLSEALKTNFLTPYRKILQKVSEITIDSINFACHTYTVNVGSVDTVQQAVAFFRQIADQEMSALHKKDKIQFFINHPELTSPFYTSLTYVEDFNADTILNAIQKVVQLNQNFVIYYDTTIQMTTCMNPPGSAFKKAATCEDVLKKKCVIQIQNLDDLVLHALL